MLTYLMATVRRRKGEKGQGLVEYALIVSLIAAVCVGALIGIGHSVLGRLGGELLDALT